MRPVGAVSSYPQEVLALLERPERIPVITDPSVAARWPHLAVLSVMAHGRGEQGAAIAAAALPALRGLDDESVRVYVDILLTHVSDAVRPAVEAMVIDNGYHHLFASKFVAQGHLARGADDVRR